MARDGDSVGAAMRNIGGSFYDFEAMAFEGVKRRVLASPPNDWGGRAAQASGGRPWEVARDMTRPSRIF